MSNLSKVTSPTDTAIRKIAMDVGKQVVAHIEWAYPEMFKAVAAKSAKLSIRNATHNAIIAAVNAADLGRDEEQIASNAAHRRKIRRMAKALELHAAGEISPDELLRKVLAE